MRLKLLDVDAFVKINKCVAVTDTSILDSPGMPSEGGLLSYEIFGMPGTAARMSKYAYIDLKEPFFNPVVFKAILGKHRLLDSIITGGTRVYIDESGELQVDEKEERSDSGTGIGWLIKNYRRINFARNESLTRDVDLDIIEKADERVATLTKIPVIPAGYRDFIRQSSTGGERMAIHELTTMYNSLMNNARLLERFNGDLEQGNLTRLRVQNTILEIYRYILDILGKKSGFIKSNIMKKAVDYGVLSIITPSDYKTKSPKDIAVPFGYIGMPINQIVTTFKPFFVAGLRQFLLEEIRNIRQIESALDIEYDLEDGAENLVQDAVYIESIITKFVDSPENRFDVIVPPQRSNPKPLKIFINNAWRDMTLMDMFFILAYDITRDKHVSFTRYPVENFQSKALAKITIITTLKTITVDLRGRIYTHYPLIKNYPDPSKVLIESAVINVAYCPAMGADFDGDTMFIEGLFTEEANIESDRLVRGKAMLLDPKGANSRGISAEGMATLYAMTSEGPSRLRKGK
jgi:DNA-directed RNA polymerase beta' subunit